MQCPLCSADSKRVFEVKDYWIRDCTSCAHRFTELAVAGDHVEKIYDDSYFNGGGAGYTDYLQESRILRQRGKWYGRLLAKYVRKGKVLDIGAAAGFVLQGLVDTGWNGVGVEPNASMAEFGRKNLNLDIRRSSVENYRTDEQFDMVTMIQVMAHFAKPKDVFGRVSGVVKENGHLLVETWNRKSLSEKIFGTKWHEYSPPSVLHFFTDERIDELAMEHGFERVATGRPSKWISGVHAKSLINFRLGKTLILGKLLALVPDWISIPYPSEDLFWVLYKKK
jgi:SAM-dependent methyltransferase